MTWPCGRATTAALLPSPRTGSVRHRSRRRCVTPAFHVLLIAIAYSRRRRKTSWDFIGDVIGPCVRRECACHQIGPPSANRIRGGRRSPQGGGDSGLRPLRGSSSSNPAKTHPHPTTKAGLFVTAHCWTALATFPWVAPEFCFRVLVQHGLNEWVDHFSNVRATGPITQRLTPAVQGLAEGRSVIETALALGLR